jgi:hypothetical protein
MAPLMALTLAGLLLFVGTKTTRSNDDGEQRIRRTTRIFQGNVVGRHLQKDFEILLRIGARGRLPVCRSESVAISVNAIFMIVTWPRTSTLRKG